MTENTVVMERKNILSCINDNTSNTKESIDELTEKVNMMEKKILANHEMMVELFKMLECPASIKNKNVGIKNK